MGESASHHAMHIAVTKLTPELELVLPIIGISSSRDAPLSILLQVAASREALIHDHLGRLGLC